jgi:hypothetical protein
MIFSSNFHIINMNFFFHFKIGLKHEINDIIRKNNDTNMVNFLKKIFKEKKKKISFVKCKPNDFIKEIKYFKFKNLYIYSQNWNKSNLNYNFFINFQNQVSIVDKISLIENEIMLNITSKNGRKFLIKKSQIQNQILCLSKNWFVSLNEPNWLI